MDIKDITELFKVLGDRNRLRIVAALARRSACVCELAQALGLNQPNLSRHLRLLERAGVVESRRNGAWTDYTLRRDAATRPILRWIKNAVAADEEIRQDLAALARADRCEIWEKKRRKKIKPKRETARVNGKGSAR